MKKKTRFRNVKHQKIIKAMITYEKKRIQTVNEDNNKKFYNLLKNSTIILIVLY